jgi:hypothetical protein
MKSITRTAFGAVALGAAAVAGSAFADATPAPTAAATPMATVVATPAPTPAPWYSNITLGGYTYAYYQQSLNNPASSASLTRRAFDTTENQFTLGGGELTLTQGDKASNTGYYVDLLFGQEADIYDSSVNGNTTTNSLQIGQAYLTETFGNAKFTLGKFGTSVGNEVTYLPSNANFSRSLLFQNEPLYSVGVKLDYTLPSSLVATVWADNGNDVDTASNSAKGFGGALAYSGIKNLSLTGIYYLDPNAYSPDTTLVQDNDYFNLVATYTLNSSLNFAGEYLLVENIAPNKEAADAFGSPKQQGYALYATYATPIANLSLSPRVESWFEPDAGAQLNDYTVTLKYVAGPVSNILEYRLDDTANTPGSFSYSSYNSSAPSTEFQQTITYAAYYSF